MNQSKANQAMLRRLLLAVAVMFVFTYGLVAVYDKVSDEMGGANERIATAPAGGHSQVKPGPQAMGPAGAK